VGVGLAVVTGVEQPRPGGELGGHIHHVLPVGQQPLRQRTPCTVAALDRPDPVRPGRDVLEHRGVAGVVDAEPAGRQHSLVVVDDLDGHRQLVGIDPDVHLHAALGPSS
jgi:hypothetical protein